MSKKIIITGQLLIFLISQAFSQSDTTVCIDINSDLNHKTRKNIIGIHTSLGATNSFPFELSYERILKENNTIKLSFGGFPNFSFHCNIAYRSYFSNMKYKKTSYNDNTYFIRNQQTNMSAPRGLYLEAMGVFSKHDYNFYSINKNKIIGLGVGLGYQFIIFNRLALNPSIQLPFTLETYYYSDYYSLKPEIILNLNLGFAF